MEGYCSTGQSPQWAVVPMEEEEEEDICIYVCMYVCMCVYVCVCIRVYIYIYIYNEMWSLRRRICALELRFI